MRSHASTRRSCRPARIPRCLPAGSASRSAPQRLRSYERRVGVLREHYGDITLHRPAGLQHQLFFDHLPRPDGGLTRDYVQQLTVEQFGAMVPTATRTVGSRRGPYLGYTPTGAPRPVRYDPTQAPREDRASAVLLVGTLGSGKTVTAQAIAYAARAPRVTRRRLRPQARPRVGEPPRARRGPCRYSSSPGTQRSRASSTRCRSASRTCARSSPAPTCWSCCVIRRRRGRTRSAVPSRTPSVRARAASCASCDGCAQASAGRRA